MSDKIGTSPLIPPLNTVVITDLDGTLLDHDSYSYAPALPALHQLKARCIPVVLCSSKTRSEMVFLRAELDLDTPYIVENGAAIAGLKFQNGADLEVLGTDIEQIRAVLSQSRRQARFKFTGFGDMTVDDVVAATGLSQAQAILAKRREYSEPLIWQDSEENRQRFINYLDRSGLIAQQGGRFLTVAGQSTKGRAVDWLRDYYQSSMLAPVRVIALGDSPNDESMLNAADVAVIVKSDKSDTLHIGKPRQVIRTRERGPAGWCAAILQLIENESP